MASRKAPARDSMIVYGVNPVREAVRSEGYRPSVLYVEKGKTGHKGQIDWIVKRVERDGPERVRMVERKELDRRCGGGNHQGVCAEVAAYRYVDPAAVIADAGGPLTVLLLDGVTDPQNLGAVCRSAAALGADLICLPEDRSARVNSTVARVSSGAVFHLGIAVVHSLNRLVGDLKDAGFSVYGLERSAGRSLADADLGPRIALCVGAEDRGIRKSLRARCDELLRLPTDDRFPQLNVAAAAAVALYAIEGARSGK